MKFSKPQGIALLTLLSVNLAIAQAKPSGTPSPSAPKKASGSQSSTSQTTGQQAGEAKPPTSAATASQPPNAPQAKTSNSPPESVVPPTATVITIEGLCDTPPPSLTKPAEKPQLTQPCRTQVSRADFEKLLSKVAPPNPNADIKKRVADTYASLLTMAKEGDKLGADKDPSFQEQLEIVKLQLKAQWLQRKIDAEASNISDSDLKTYYDANGSSYEEATLDRVFVPKTPPAAPNASSASGAANPAASTDPQQLAEQARQRLQKGEDPAKVQADIFQQAKNPATVPQTRREHVRRGTSLPPADEPKIFALKPGEVSDVMSDAIGYTVYKMEEKKQLPFDAMKNDIKTTLASQRMKDRFTAITSSTKTQLNEDYFGPSQPPQSANPRSANPQQGNDVHAMSGAQAQSQKATPPANSSSSTTPKK